MTGNNAGAGAPRNRIGSVSHSVVLGTFNVGDQGGGIVPDINRVCLFFFFPLFGRLAGLIFVSLFEVQSGLVVAKECGDHICISNSRNSYFCCSTCRLLGLF